MSLSKSNLELITDLDVVSLLEAEKHYGDSWKKRGGVDSFMMLARKWDRIEHQVEKTDFNILEACTLDTRPEGIMDDIRDLRRYLILVENEMLPLKEHPNIERIDGPDYEAQNNEDEESIMFVSYTTYPVHRPQDNVMGNESVVNVCICNHCHQEFLLGARCSNCTGKAGYTLRALPTKLKLEVK